MYTTIKTTDILNNGKIDFNLLTELLKRINDTEYYEQAGTNYDKLRCSRVLPLEYINVVDSMLKHLVDLVITEEVIGLIKGSDVESVCKNCEFYKEHYRSASKCSFAIDFNTLERTFEPFDLPYTDRAYPEDYEEYQATLIVGPDFSCKHFKEKELNVDE